MNFNGESLPPGWSRATLPDLIGKGGLMTDGDWVESEDQDPGGRVRLTQLADVGDGVFRDRSNRFLTEAKAQELKCTPLEKGDVMIARMPDPLGRACLFPGSDRPCVTVVDVCVVRPGVANVESRWLMHFVNAPASRRAIASLQAGSTRKRISKANLSSIPFPVAPANEQRRIVAAIESYFSRLDDATATLERIQRNLERYRASVLKAAVEGRLVLTEAELARTEGRPADLPPALRPSPTKHRRAGRLWGSGSVPALSDSERDSLPTGWRWEKVGGLGVDRETTVQVGPMSMRSADFEDRGVPVLNVGCVGWGEFFDAKLNFLPQDKAAAFSRYRIESGDVLFTRSGTVGRCAVARAEHAGRLMTFHLLRIRPHPSICDSRYLQIALEGAPHVRRQTREASIGTTRSGFNTNLLADLDVPLPPLSEQYRIIEAVDSKLSVLAHARVQVKGCRHRLDRLRQSVLSWAFAGCLVDQDPGDEPATVLLERIRAERGRSQKMTRSDSKRRRIPSR